MAHNLNIDSNGVARMFVAGELPWHKLGRNVADAVSWKQAMELGGLDWIVNERMLYTDSDLHIPTHKALTRFELDGKEIPLGVVGCDYHVIQNGTAFDWTETLLNAGAKYESAGALGNGSRIWVLARVQEADYSIGDDKHQSYLLFETSHDGSRAATAKLTDVRVVCQNTLNAALSGNGSNLRIRHTKSAQERFDAAVRMIGNTVVTAKQLGEKLELLANKLVTKETYEAVLSELFPTPAEDKSKASKTRHENILLEIAQNLKSNDKGAFPEQAGTAYALFNSITNYVDHARANRSSDLLPNADAGQLRSMSAMFGSGAEIKERALVAIGKTVDSMPDRPRAFVVPELPEIPESSIAEPMPAADPVSSLSKADAINTFVNDMPNQTLSDRDAIAYARAYAIWCFRPGTHIDVQEPTPSKFVEPTHAGNLRQIINDILNS